MFDQWQAGRMGAPAELHEHEVIFRGGPFDGCRGMAVSRFRSCPFFLYVLPGGDVVSHDAIVDGSREASVLARRAHLYAVDLLAPVGEGPHPMGYLHGPTEAGER